MAGEEPGSRQGDPAPFLRANGLQRIHGVAWLPAADLDKDEAGTVPHDEINFAETAAKIARDKHQSVVFKQR